MFVLLAALPKLARLWRGWVFSLLVRAAGGVCGRGTRIEAGFRLRHGFHRGLALGDNVYFGRYTTIDCPRGGRLEIGSRVTFTQGLFLSVVHTVTIGDDVLIGEYVSLRDANHEIADLATPIANQPMRSGAITIAGDVWIGRGCAVLSGASIEQGCVIGANSVVTGSLAAGTIAAGAPARPIRTRA